MQSFRKPRPPSVICEKKVALVFIFRFRFNDNQMTSTECTGVE